MPSTTRCFEYRVVSVANGRQRAPPSTGNGPIGKQIGKQPVIRLARADAYDRSLLPLIFGCGAATCGTPLTVFNFMFMTPLRTEMIAGVVIALLRGVLPAVRVRVPLVAVRPQEVAFGALGVKALREDRLKVRVLGTRYGSRHWNRRGWRGEAPATCARRSTIVHPSERARPALLRPPEDHRDPL